ncbi:MAG: M1 family peptidase [Bacteroidetes bacterium]|nr:MAG: M1 family peptidase [Bacteroidota bacterium]
MLRIFSSLLLCFFLTLQGLAQPNSFDPTIEPAAIFEQAVAKGSRTREGLPGLNYFQNRASYAIQAQLDPVHREVRAQAEIQYVNQSPDTLHQLVFRMYQDMYKPGFRGDYRLPQSARTQGVVLEGLRLRDDSVLLAGPSSPVSRRGTNMYLQLDPPLAPGETVSCGLAWYFTVSKRAIRMGQYEDNAWFIAYWYPQVAVYDDLYGWDTLSYTGQAEFYNDFNDFDLQITVPDTMLVWATGTWENADEILTEPYLGRWQAAASSDTVIQILNRDSYASGRSFLRPSASGTHTFRFRAKGVPDVAFGASDYYFWDGCSAVVDEKGRRARVQAVYRPASQDFYQVAAHAKAAVEDLSWQLPGVPYPYPVMTVFNGESFGGGGMEFPMIVNDGSSSNEANAFSLTYHEIAHTYFPFLMGINERRYAWMDEGWATMLPEDQMMARGYSGSAMMLNAMIYARYAGGGQTAALMTPAYQLGDAAYSVSAYYHPATAYYVLRHYLGDSLFRVALQTYIQRWRGRHPHPQDFFATFDQVAGQDLGWFWRPWFFETKVPDLKLDVKAKRRKVTFTVQNAGGLPLPILLRYTLKDGTDGSITVPADYWQPGVTSWSETRKLSGRLQKADLGAPFVPDAHTRDNYFGKE